MKNKTKICIIIIIIIGIILSIIAILKIFNNNSKIQNTISTGNTEIPNNQGTNSNGNYEVPSSQDVNIIINSKKQKFNTDNRQNIITILAYSASSEKDEGNLEKYYIYKNEDGTYLYDKKIVYSDTSSEQLITTKEIKNANDILDIETDYIKSVKEFNKHLEEMYPTESERKIRRETLFADYVYINENGEEIKINKEDLIEKILENDKNNTDIQAGFNIVNITYSFYGDESDSGTEIKYQLYVNTDGTYHYDKLISYVTIAGLSEPVSIEQGEIKSKSDLLKIDNSMEERAETSPVEQYLDVHYTFNHPNGWTEKVESIEILSNKLF